MIPKYGESLSNMENRFQEITESARGLLQTVEQLSTMYGLSLNETAQVRADLTAAQARITELEAELSKQPEVSMAEYNQLKAKLASYTILEEPIDKVKLETENAQLRAALQPFADDWQVYLDTGKTDDLAFHQWLEDNVDWTYAYMSFENAYDALNPARETDEILSETDFQNMKQYIHDDELARGIISDAHRCPNCGEIFGEPEDGLLECSKCGNQYEAQSITGGA